MYFATGSPTSAKSIEILNNKLLHFKGECLESKKFIFSLHTTYIFKMDLQAPGEASSPLGRTSRSTKHKYLYSSIRGDIRKSRCTTGDVDFDTGGKWKKSSIIKVLIIYFGHLWE
jgi:hypothetical protein